MCVFLFLQNVSQLSFFFCPFGLSAVRNAYKSFNGGEKPAVSSGINIEVSKKIINMINNLIIVTGFHNTYYKLHCRD